MIMKNLIIMLVVGHILILSGLSLATWCLCASGVSPTMPVALWLFFIGVWLTESYAYKKLRKDLKS